MGLCGNTSKGQTDPVREGVLSTERERGLHFCAEQLKQHMLSGDLVVVQALLTASLTFISDASTRAMALDLLPVVIGCMRKWVGNALVQAPSCGILLHIT